MYINRLDSKSFIRNTSIKFTPISNNNWEKQETFHVTHHFYFTKANESVYYI